MASHGQSKIAVIGLGRMGSALAVSLTRRGIDVLGIDSDEATVQALADDLPHLVRADATDPGALEQLHLGEYDRIVIAIGEHLEASILATSLIAELGVPEIWAKANSVRHARILSRMGAHHVVLPEHEAGERLSHLVAGHMQDFLAVDDEYAFIRADVPGRLVGQTLQASGVRRSFGVTVVAIKRAGGQFTYATPETLLMEGDILIVSGQTPDVERFAEMG